MSTTIGLLPNSGRKLFSESDDEEEIPWLLKKNKQTNKQTAPLGATKYEKRNGPMLHSFEISFRVK